MRASQVVLFRFPLADLSAGQLRPALLVGQRPGPYDDWLVAMVSSQLRPYNAAFDEDEIVGEGDSDFAGSGLKVASLIRGGRLAVVEREVLAGAIGAVSDDRLRRIRTRLAQWLLSVEG
jgi:mRNA interferase MazF